MFKKVVHGPALVSFPNSSSRFDLNAMAGKLVGGGIQSRILPKERRTFFPKTMVSWLRMLSLHHDLHFVHRLKILLKTKKRRCWPQIFSILDERVNFQNFNEVSGVFPLMTADYVTQEVTCQVKMN